MLEQVPGVQGRNGLSVPSIQNFPKSRTVYTFGYAKRPLYPVIIERIPRK